MNILIVEDNDEKRNAIIKAIKDKCSNAKIRWFNNYEDSARFIEDNKGYINLLLLDWCFPQTSYSQTPVY
jgi:DNA-binding response OmpR family regulator